MIRHIHHYVEEPNMSTEEKPELIAFEVTGQCQFNCAHCRSNARGGVNGRELTTLECKKILVAIANYHKCTVVLTGGEPMERPDLCDLLRYAKGLGLRTAMATCGYLMNEMMMKRFKALDVTTLSLTLDGANERKHDTFRRTPGAFHAVIHTAELAKKAAMRFQVNTTVNRGNLDQIKEIAALAESLGAYCFNPYIMLPSGQSSRLEDQALGPIEYEVLLNDLYVIKQNFPVEVRVSCGPQFARVSKPIGAERRLGVGCLGGREHAFITHRGQVQTCGYLPVSAGNLLENEFDFEDIWENAQLFEAMRSRKNLPETCQSCDHGQDCGGCRARAYALSGDPMGADSLCSRLSDSV
jgi:radical SAM protein with 4Fe4S-binding SPASM domain